MVSVSEAVAASRFHEALVLLNELLADMAVVPGELFRLRAGILSRLGHKEAAARDRERAGTSGDFIPVTRLAEEINPGGQGKVLPWQSTIIIPVHNGGPVVSDCLESVIRQLPPDCGIVVVDDGTSETETREFIKDFARHKSVRIKRHREPRGFVQSVNAGMAMAPDGPVILLNSDTYVPRGTIARLLGHLASDAFTGTVTPFSNNGGSFSFPEPRRAFAMPTPEQSEAIAAVAATVNAGKSVDVLNGNGFCMVISAACRRDLPRLSAEYGAGYYEEVDYSLRARARGYRNICATDCFVAHYGSASFGAAKRNLVDNNLLVLRALFPGYQADYNRYTLLDPLRSFRQNILAQISYSPISPARMEEHLVITLPTRMNLLGRDGVTMPLHGTLAASSLQAKSSDLTWLDATKLSAHGITLSCIHSMSAHWEQAGSEANLAVVDNDKLVAAVRFGPMYRELPEPAVRTLEQAILQHMQSAHAA